MPHPEAAKHYYSACRKIDQHNCCQKQSLDLEKELGTHDWSQQLNFSLLVISVDDYWLLYDGISFSNKANKNQYFINLATELIDY